MSNTQRSAHDGERRGETDAWVELRWALGRGEASLRTTVSRTASVMSLAALGMGCLGGGGGGRCFLVEDDVRGAGSTKGSEWERCCLEECTAAIVVVVVRWGSFPRQGPSSFIIPYLPPK